MTFVLLGHFSTQTWHYHCQVPSFLKRCVITDATFRVDNKQEIWRINRGQQEETMFIEFRQLCQEQAWCSRGILQARRVAVWHTLYFCELCFRIEKCKHRNKRLYLRT